MPYIRVTFLVDIDDLDDDECAALIDTDHKMGVTNQAFENSTTTLKTFTHAAQDIEFSYQEGE